MMSKLSLSIVSILFFPVLLFANCDPSFTMSVGGNNISGQGDTICVGVVIDFTNTSDLMGGENPTFTQWSFGDASPLDINENASHSYTQAGMYVITYTIASPSCTGLIYQDSVYVIAAPGLQSGASDATCFGVCDGTANVNITGSHTNYHVMWDDPDMQTTTTAFNLCAGSYVATASDDYGCSTFLNEIIVNEPEEMTVDVVSPVFICMGDNPYQIQTTVTGGTSPYYFTWNPGISAGLDDASSDSPTLTPNNNSFTTFTVSVTDENGCPPVEAYVEVKKREATILGAIIDEGSGSAMAAIITLYKVDTDNQRWITLDVDTTFDGNYMFDSIPVGIDVIIYARPLMTPSQNLPMYHGFPNDTADWQGAIQIPLTCGLVLPGKNIVLPHVNDLIGDCTFQGFVYLVSTGKTQTEDPIPLIDVVVKKTPPGNAIAFTQTETNAGGFEGRFTFNNIEPILPDTVYTFTVNIPGLNMLTNYEISVDIDDLLFDELNFYVDTTSGTGGIWTENPLGVNPIKRERTEMLAYPNPFSDNCELRFPNTENGTFSFTLFDVTGKLIISEEEQEGNTYLMKTQNLDQGVYIAEVRTADEVFRTRVLKK